jgi:hypothetical protein
MGIDTCGSVVPARDVRITISRLGRWTGDSIDQRAAVVGIQVGVGDRVAISTGPLSGAVGRVVEVDRDQRTARVDVVIVRDRQRRRARTIASVDALRHASARPRSAPEPESVPIDKIQAMRIMHSLGDSYTRIAHAFGVSKRTVVHHVEQE